MTVELEQLSDRNVCIMGLGYVGLTLAVVMAEVGFNVTGVEIDKNIVNKLAAGEPHFFEPSLDDRLKRVVAMGRLSIRENIPDNAQLSVFFVTVGTPLDANKSVRTDMIKNVIKEISGMMPEDALIILRSTVQLGTTRNLVLPILKASEKSFDLVFCPERTLEGKALRELRELPQIVGGETMGVRNRAAKIFQFITPTVVQVSNLETAEMIKLVDNSQRDVQFALANEVAMMSDAIGVSALEVIQAGKLGYSRTNLPVPGPVGGPCLEKDSYILSSGLERFGYTPELIMKARKQNESQPDIVINRLAKFTKQILGLSKPYKILVAGMAFKGRPETDDMRGTMAQPILEALTRYFERPKVILYDPVIDPEVLREKFNLPVTVTLEEGFFEASIVIFANNHPEFEYIPVGVFAERMASPSVIFDFWNNFSSNDVQIPSHVTYVGLGELGRKEQELK